MQRGAAISMALTTLILPVLMIGHFFSVDGVVDGWWVPVSLTAVLGAAAMLLVIGVRGDAATIGPGAVALGAANIVTLFLWIPAWSEQAAPELMGSPPVWPANTVVLPAIVLATVYRPWVPFGYLVVGLGTLATVQQLAKQGRFGDLAYVNALLTASLMGVLIALTYAAMGGVRLADRRREDVLHATFASASRAARIAERDRWDAVVRDQVVAVLRGISTDETDPRARVQARAALDALDGTAARAEAVELTGAETRVRLLDAVNALGDDTIVEVDVPDVAVRYPYPVAEAVTDAAVEAVTNARRHAGPSASRALLGVLDGDLIRLRVVDDGVGFDPNRVAADRSGVEMGIRRRMANLPGGGGWVRSAPGDGTVVSIEWRRS
ncbi:sensor histidine kinase [Gordonia shandongensis]|uniref:sensor histidine kinase n=1 Tax=Gordonia shandongensis TaxID=376351 RepID=UPI0004086DC8|nr:ATP-binding protein [Gordonia shandongensis]